jgi:hypothetical protein
MAWVHGNSNFRASAGTTNSCAYASNTAGNLLVVGVVTAQNAKTSLSDTAGNIWQTAFIQGPNITWGLRIFYAENCNASAGTNTVSVTSSSAARLDMCLGEWSGMAASLSFSFASQSATTLSTTVSPVVSGDLIVAFGFCLGVNIAAGAGLTARETPRGATLMADGTATGTSFTATMTGTSTQSIIAVAFHASPAPSQGLYKGSDYSNSNGATGTYIESANFVSNTAGNLLLAFVVIGDTSSTSSVSDTAGNTWTFLASVLRGAAWVERVYYAANCNVSSGLNTVTVTATLTTGSRVRIAIAEYASATPTANATANTLSGSTISASVSSTVGALVVACGMSDATSVAAGAGYSGRKTDGSMMIEDGTASANPEVVSMTLSATGASIIALSIGSPLTPAQPQIWIIT